MNRLSPQPPLLRWLRLVGDLGVGLAAFFAAFKLRILLPLPFTQFLLPADRMRYFHSEWWVALGSLLLLLYLFGLYDPPIAARAERARRLAVALAALMMGLMGYYFLTIREFPRSVLILFVLLTFAGLLLWRGLLDRLGTAPKRRLAIVGCGAAALELSEKIGREPELGLEIAGYVPAPDEDGEEEIESLQPRLGSVEDLPGRLARGEVDDIVFAYRSRPWQTRLLEGLAEVRPQRSSVLLLPGPVESLIGRMRYRWVQDVPLIEVMRPSEWSVHPPTKRFLDLTVGSLLLLLTLPLMALCAVAVLLLSGRPILYRQTRVGRDRRPFTLRKFRTMRPDAERHTGEVLARRDDPRLTGIGAFLRRYRLDELPQLFNVLEGTMSLVGPRPERPGFVRQYLEEIPGYFERFAVLPGLTGLAQVNGDYHSSPANKLRYDLAYVANWSPWLDLTILLRTVKLLLTTPGT